MSRAELVCSGSGMLKREPVKGATIGNRGGGRSGLKARGNSYKGRCVYVSSNVFIFWGAEFTLAPLQQSSLQRRQSLSQCVRPHRVDGGDKSRN